MGLHVSPVELAGEWSLSFADIDFVNGKPDATRLGLAVQLKFFSTHGFFIAAAADAREEAVSYLAEQLGIGRPIFAVTIFPGARGDAIAPRF